MRLTPRSPRTRAATLVGATLLALTAACGDNKSPLQPDTTKTIPKPQITPAGGSVSFDSGRVVLTAPANAVAATITPTFTALSGSSLPVDSLQIAGTAVALGPLNTAFNPAAVVTLKYNPAAKNPAVPDSELTLVLTNSFGSTSELSTHIDPVAHTASAPITTLGTLWLRRTAVAKIAVTPFEPSVIVGSTQQFKATLSSAAGKALTSPGVTWSSSNPDVATISNTGVLTAKATGVTIVSAYSDGLIAGTAVVVAPRPVAGVFITPDTGTIVIGAQRTVSARAVDATGQTLSGRNITWKSNDPNVATVTGGNTSATISAVGLGTTTITATSEGKSGVFTVTVVRVPVASVVVTPDSVDIQSEDVLQLSAKAYDAAGNELTDRAITWSTTTPAKIDLTSIGAVVGRQAGRGLVQATADGVVGTAVIRVHAVPVANGNAIFDRSPIVVGDTTRIRVRLLDSGGNLVTYQNVLTYTSSDPTIAVVDEQGLVTALKAGTVTISATTQDGFTVGAVLSVTTPTP